MKKKGVLFLTAFALVFLFLLSTGKAYGENEAEVKGTVFAVDNDDKGNVIAVSILDATGEEYFVVRDAIGDELLKLIDKNVKATGVITVDKDGKKHLRIIKFDFFAS